MELSSIASQVSSQASAQISAQMSLLLLRKTLEQTDRTAIVRFSLRQKTRLAALRVRGDVLVLQTLLWADEVREAAFPALDEPVLLADEHGEVAVYGIPYLEPEVARHELGLAGRAEPALRGHEGVLTAAMERIRADLFLRPGVRSVVLAHAFVGGGVPSESERDICVGGVDLVPAGVFDGVDYVALGHIHGRQQLSDRVRYAGAPLHYSFGEGDKPRGSWLIDLDAEGVADATWLALPVPRRLVTLRGPFEDLLTGAAHADAEDAWVCVEYTDALPARDPLRRLQERFPHCAKVVHAPEVVAEHTGGTVASETRSPAPRLSAQ